MKVWHEQARKILCGFEWRNNRIVGVRATVLTHFFFSVKIVLYVQILRSVQYCTCKSQICTCASFLLANKKWLCFDFFWNIKTIACISKSRRSRQNNWKTTSQDDIIWEIDGHLRCSFISALSFFSSASYLKEVKVF
jgi:hypothetical protein